MARDPTRFSRVSIGWIDSEQTLVDQDATDSGAIFSVGKGNADILDISTSTHADDLGTVTANESSAITVGHSDATRGDTWIVTRDSEFSGADQDISLYAYSGDTTGEVNVVAVNSTITDVDTTVGVFRLTRINFASYL